MAVGRAKVAPVRANIFIRSWDCLQSLFTGHPLMATTVTLTLEPVVMSINPIQKGGVIKSPPHLRPPSTPGTKAETLLRDTIVKLNFEKHAGFDLTLHTKLLLSEIKAILNFHPKYRAQACTTYLMPQYFNPRRHIGIPSNIRFTALPYEIFDLLVNHLKQTFEECYKADKRTLLEVINTFTNVAAPITATKQDQPLRFLAPQKKESLPFTTQVEQERARTVEQRRALFELAPGTYPPA